jgi:hypothetical protein
MSFFGRHMRVKAGTTNPGVFARLRSFAANILRFNQRSSVRQGRYAAALGEYQALAKLNFR